MSGSPDKTAELWLEIDQLHLSYLQHEETPPKLELRKRLERRVREYLCIVTQDRKFVNITTGDIIINSAKWIPDFSLVKAAQAFCYIEQYAANLINQPWRHEYRTIRQYNGYYMHNVKSSLSGADKLFFDMGYTRAAADPEILQLDLPPSEDITTKIDCVTKVARDCLLACVECNILQEIYTGLAAHFPTTVEELLEFRRDYAGTPEDAIREIHYRKNQLLYQYPSFNHRMSQMYAPYSVGLPGFPAYAGALGPLPAGLAPLAGQLPAGYPLAATGYPPSAAATSAASLMSNGHGISIPTQVAVSGMNGYYPQAVSPQQRPYSAQVAALSSVPTGRLLDLVEHSPAGSSTSTLRQAHIPTTILELTAGEERPKSGERYGDVSRGGGGARPRDCWADTLARDGGGGGSNDRQRSSAEARRTERGIKSGVRNPAANNGEEEFIENWEFVFSDLQQRGYTKDQAERPDVLTAARQSRGNTETPSSSRMYNLTSGDQSEEEEALRNLGLLQLREVERTGEERVDNNGARNRTSREISREITSESEQENSKYSSAQSKNSSNTERDYRQALIERPQRGNRTKSVHESSEKWPCNHCTFLNLGGSKICEVCARTRTLDPASSPCLEPVQQKIVLSAGHNGTSISYSQRAQLQDKLVEPVVGQECPRCTLVNPPNRRVCEACDSTLGAPPIIPSRKRV